MRPHLTTLNCGLGRDSIAMLCLLAERHPSGSERPRPPGDYAPGERDGIPLKADGTPADICAGWAAMRARVLRGEVAE